MNDAAGSAGQAQAGGPGAAAPSVFSAEKRIRFHHCDPAGIVFYPQYFVLFHELMEDWFRDGLGIDYAAFVRDGGMGLPTVKVDCEFLAPNPLGDLLRLELHLTRLGQASIALRIHGHANGRECVRANLTVVHASLHPLRSAPIPDALREKMARFLAPAPAPG
jgi:4-hydroxybenzoyl-CoA thioesterase